MTAPDSPTQAFHFTAVAPGIDRIDGFFPPGVSAFQTNRLGGQSAFPYDSLNLATHVEDHPQVVLANRAYLDRYLPQSPQWLAQVHGTQVCKLDEVSAQPPQEQRADAAVSAKPGRICAVMTADCLPVLIARGDGAVVGSAHAGWRGLCAGVIESTVHAMAQSAPGADRHEWLFWLGPAIGQTAFEVGPEVREAFLANAITAGEREQLLQTGPTAQSCAFVPGAQPEKWLASLTVLAQMRIQRVCEALRLEQVRIAVYTGCVFHEPDRYFSFRRDQKTGRMASLIWRNPR